MVEGLGRCLHVLLGQEDAQMESMILLCTRARHHHVQYRKGRCGV